MNQSRVAIAKYLNHEIRTRRWWWWIINVMKRITLNINAQDKITNLQITQALHHHATPAHPPDNLQLVFPFLSFFFSLSLTIIILIETQSKTENAQLTSTNWPRNTLYKETRIITEEGFYYYGLVCRVFCPLQLNKYYYYYYFALF